MRPKNLITQQQLVIWICGWGKLVEGNQMIIAMAALIFEKLSFQNVFRPKRMRKASVF